MMFVSKLMAVNSIAICVLTGMAVLLAIWGNGYRSGADRARDVAKEMGAKDVAAAIEAVVKKDGLRP